MYLYSISNTTTARHRNASRWLVELQRLFASGERERYLAFSSSGSACASTSVVCCDRPAVLWFAVSVLLVSIAIASRRRQSRQDRGDLPMIVIDTVGGESEQTST